MVKIESLMKEKRISKINEFEVGRYLNFFENSYKDNLEHSEANMTSFPRWSIISGYYAMHDITKLFLAKQFMIKIDFNVHITTIEVLKQLIKNKEIIKLIEDGYEEFISLANDLAEAKEERTSVQYYTGTNFMKEEYKKKARDFNENNVLKYISKIKELMK